MAKKKPTWEELKAEYITGNMSYRQLAEKYHMSHPLIMKRGAKEKWTAERKKNGIKVVEKLTDIVNDDKANKLAGLGIAADKMADTIQRVMNDSDQFFRRVDLKGEEVISQKADTKAMKELASAMKDLTSVLRNVYNIPTEAEAVSLQIAREKLEIEKRNAERDEELGLTTGIVLIPQVVDDEDEE